MNVFCVLSLKSGSDGGRLDMTRPLLLKTFFHHWKGPYMIWVSFGPLNLPFFLSVSNILHVMLFLRIVGIGYIFHLFIWFLCTHWQCITSEVTLFSYLTMSSDTIIMHNQSKIDIFHLFFFSNGKCYYNATLNMDNKLAQLTDNYFNCKLQL